MFSRTSARSKRPLPLLRLSKLAIVSCCVACFSPWEVWVHTQRMHPPLSARRHPDPPQSIHLQISSSETSVRVTTEVHCKGTFLPVMLLTFASVQASHARAAATQNDGTKQRPPQKLRLVAVCARLGAKPHSVTSGHQLMHTALLVRHRYPQSPKSLWASTSWRVGPSAPPLFALSARPTCSPLVARSPRH